MIEIEEYKILQQHQEDNRLLFDKIIRLSDDIIYEKNVTKTKSGILIHLYCEENNYRKLMLVFMDDAGGNNHFKLSEAPLPTVAKKIVYWASNETPPPLFWEHGIKIGDKAREYHKQLKEWEHELFIYDSEIKAFSNKTNKNITDYKYLFQMG